uniref:Uncharacterized protein n=1 Tax=Pseudomonas phage MK TaxID=3015287 RepID=A0AAT9TT25_9VIRU
MKLEDVKKGQVVQVDYLNMDIPRPTFEQHNSRSTGVVAGVDRSATCLNVKVLFHYGELDWGNAADIELIHSDPEDNERRKRKVNKIISKIDKLFDEVWEVTQQ